MTTRTRTILTALILGIVAALAGSTAWGGPSRTPLATQEIGYAQITTSYQTRTQIPHFDKILTIANVKTAAGVVWLELFSYAVEKAEPGNVHIDFFIDGRDMGRAVETTFYTGGATYGLHTRDRYTVKAGRHTFQVGIAVNDGMGEIAAGSGGAYNLGRPAYFSVQQ